MNKKRNWGQNNGVINGKEILIWLKIIQTQTISHQMSITTTAITSLRTKIRQDHQQITKTVAIAATKIPITAQMKLEIIK